MRQNLKNPRWWVALVPALLVAVVGIPAEWITERAHQAMEWLYDWVYDKEV